VNLKVKGHVESFQADAVYIKMSQTCKTHQGNFAKEE
jgi:hypothetical protein